MISRNGMTVQMIPIDQNSIQSVEVKASWLVPVEVERMRALMRLLSPSSSSPMRH